MASHDVSEKITEILATRKWKWRNDICIPRCYILGWEADLLVLNTNKRLEEIEIKISVADFKKEFKDKAKKHEKLKAGRSTLTRYWFAVPSTLVPLVKDLVPEYAGLLAVNLQGRYLVEVVKQAPTLKGAKIIPPQFEIQLLKRAYWRIW